MCLTTPLVFSISLSFFLSFFFSLFFSLFPRPFTSLLTHIVHAVLVRQSSLTIVRCFALYYFLRSSDWQDTMRFFEPLATFVCISSVSHLGCRLCPLLTCLSFLPSVPPDLTFRLTVEGAEAAGEGEVAAAAGEF